MVHWKHLICLFTVLTSVKASLLRYDEQLESDSDEISYLSLREQYEILRPTSEETNIASRSLYHGIRHSKKLDSLAEEGRDTEYTVKRVCILNDQPKVVDASESCKQVVATGRYKNSINATGWSYLEIDTNSDYANADLQAYSAGLLEGILTRTVLQYHITNTVVDYCKRYTEYCKRLFSFIQENLDYVRQRLERASPDDQYWQRVKQAYLQLTGVWDGYRQEANFSGEILYDIHPILMINMNGDFIDLEKKFNKTKKWDDGLNGKCSGFVKVTPNNEDVLISQVTMSGFQNLLRILKLYKFGYDKKYHPGHTVTMSSYPGMLYSSDDFALLSSGLAVIETTVNVFNTLLFAKIQPKGQLQTWVRAIVANSMARNGREWCQIIRRHNSGTYNNQWVVLDYNKFQPGQPLVDYGLLYVLEQMPGYTVYHDITKYLKRKGYYASYNIPFFKNVSKISGFEEKGKQFYWFNWKDCPRAQIFARDHNLVKDLDTLTSLMRYNNYQHDVLSRCDCVPPFTAEAAISTRGDLNLVNGTYPLPGMGHVNHGALDYKGTGYRLFKDGLRFRAWSGPTYDNVPVFSWKTSDLASTVKHIGHPETWNFQPEEYKWQTPIN